MEWIETSPEYYYETIIHEKNVNTYGQVLGNYYDKETSNTWSKRIGKDWHYNLNKRGRGPKVKKMFRGKYGNVLIGAEIIYIQE